MDYNIQFTQPVFLKLLYFIPIFWLVALLGVKRLAIWKLVLAIVFRSIVVTVIILLLAGISSVEKNRAELKVIYLVDISDSIDNKGEEWIGKYINDINTKLSEDTKVELNTFALNSRLIYESDSPGTKDFRFKFSDFASHNPPILPLPNKGQLELSDLNKDRTNIGSAIISSLGHFSEGSVKRIVLITDGNENVGDAIKAAALARNEEVQLYTVSPPKSPFENELLLKKVMLPSELPMGKTAEIKVVVENKSASSVKGKLNIFLLESDNKMRPELYKQWNTIFLPGINVYKVKYMPKEQGFLRFETSLETKANVNIEKNKKINPVVVTGRSQILYVNGIKGRKLFLPDTLEEREVEVNIVNPDEMPETILDMLVYDSIIFSNVSRSMLKPGQMEIIEQYVKDFGGGFVMLGGENSFIQGGYADTPIEKILPVKMEGGEHKRKEKRYRISAVLIIDKSASMGGKKITFAKKAAIELVHQLKDNDKLGIIAFDNNPYMITALRPVPAVEVDIVTKLSRLHPSGGTNIFPALRMAYLNIEDSGARKNHVILLSDGNTDFSYINKEALLKSYKNEDISISTIAIGKWFVNTDLLKEIANRTDGSFYRINDVTQLPKLIVKDVEDSISKTDIYEESFFPKKVANSQILQDISSEQLPPLKGYSITTLKIGSQAPLITDIRGKADPILANWRYGLGKTLVYTADAEARWSSNWIKWIKYNKFWSQALRWSMKDIPESDYSLKPTMIKNKPHLIIESFHKEDLLSDIGTSEDSAVGAKPMELKALLYKIESDQQSRLPRSLNVGGEESNPQSPIKNSQYKVLPLRQIGPKSYVSPLEGIEPGNYFTNVQIVKDGKILSNKTKGLIIPRFKVSKPFDSGKLYNNEELLKKIALITNGKYEPDVEDVTENLEEISKFNDLAKYLIPFAFLAFVIDIALRRI